ncbi:MAG: lipopolysaccharide biosynthesis protein [Clostridia bacterium]|nr:lipopolysaccharide biosynthesis protein [Clostridia bacterium]
MANNTKTKVVSGFFWRFAERVGAQLVAFVVSVVLARLLEPSMYGTIALITVFTTILQTFVDSGLGTALIQKKDADDLDFSTVFYTNIVFCSVLYLLMFFGAPFIAKFYKDDTLTPLVRVLSLTIVISGVKGVQQAYVSKKMIFKRFFFATLGGTLTAAAIGIWMAYHGYGVWALVAQQLINLTIDTIILWITVKWRPKKMFSFKRLKGLYSFGWKMLVSALLEKVYNDVRQLIIGRMYSPADLAYYNRAKQFPTLVVNNINTSIDSVLLPAMASAQDSREHVKSMTRRAIMTSTCIMSPLMIGLAFMSTPVIRLILTEKWLPCVPFMVIFCITYMFRPVHTANLNAIKALGRSDIFLTLEIIKRVVGVAVLLATMWFGVMAMAYSLLFVTVSSQIINSWPNKKLLNYSYLEQLKDILPGMALAAFMGVCIYPIQFIGLPDIVTILIQVPLGAAIYIAGSKLFKLEAFGFVWDTAKPMLEKFKKK